MQILKYVIALPIGVFIGGIVNIGLLFLLAMVISFPEGMDFMKPETIIAAMPEFELKHFAVPFIAHAGGTLIGAWLAALIAPKNKLIFAMIVGVIFLIGGIMNAKEIPAPMLYNILDIALCYIPMGYLGWVIAGRKA